MNIYEFLAGKPLDEDVGVTVINDFSFKDLQDRLGLASMDSSYPEVRGEINSFIDRRRDTVAGPRPMDSDTPETASATHVHSNWWGGAGGHWHADTVEYWPEGEG